MFKTLEYLTNNVNKTIEDTISCFPPDNRKLLDQLLLKHFRDLVEAFIMAYYAKSINKDIAYAPLTRDNKDGRAFMNSLKGDERFVRNFFNSLEAAASHYSNSENGAEFLTYIYIDYLTDLRDLAKNVLGVEILRNIDLAFPPESEQSRDYYDTVYNTLDNPQRTETKLEGFFEVEKCRPRRSKNNNKFFEITLQSANDDSTKTDRVIVFSSKRLRSNYLYYSLKVFETHLTINGTLFPITILLSCTETLRSHELNSLRKVLSLNSHASYQRSDKDAVFRYLAKNQLTLVDLVDLPNQEYMSLKERLTELVSSKPVFEILDKARTIIACQENGWLTIRYCLFKPRNRWLKTIIDKTSEHRISSSTALVWGCMQFEKMPFCRHLPNHEIELLDVFEVVPLEKDESQLLNRYLSNEAEKERHIYCSENDLPSRFKDTTQLIEDYNKQVYYKHRPDENIEKWHDKVYIHKYEANLIKIFTFLNRFLNQPNPAYTSYVDGLLAGPNFKIEDETKREIVRKAFSSSRLLILNGAAGTGKTTTVAYFSEVFKRNKVLYICQTHTALKNLKQRAEAHVSNATYMVVESAVKKLDKNPELHLDYELICIDECSCIPDASIAKIFERINPETTHLLLVGDPHQIQSIEYGIWFSMAIGWLPNNSQELKTPFRTPNEDLVKLWNCVRNKEKDKSVALIARNHLESDFNKLLHDQIGDSVTLCLTYDGLYGVNQINRLRQDNNHQPPDKCVKIQASTFKKGDPVLFSDSARFKDLHFNNAPGRIVDIETLDDSYIFTCYIKAAISPFDPAAKLCGLRIVTDERTPQGYTAIRFNVNKYGQIDSEQNKDDSMTIAPFQLSYALTVHKAQGLEYDSVNVVIPDETEPLITHNIFYTAITRARRDLKIFASNAGMKNIMERIMIEDIKKDLTTFCLKTGIAYHKKSN